MLQKALPKKVDKVDRVSRFRNNISEDKPYAGSEEQEEETFVPQIFWKGCAQAIQKFTDACSCQVEGQDEPLL